MSEIASSGSDRLGAKNIEQKIREFVRYIPAGDTIPDETWRGRHRNILLVVLAHVPFLLLLGLYDGTESLVTGATIPEVPLTALAFELGIVVTLVGLAALPRFGRRVRTALASTALLSCSIVLVHLSGGFIEAHFHFFVGMAVIAVYEDWVPFALGIGYVVLGHGVFGMMNPERVYNHPAAIEHPWVWGLVHGVFVLGLAAALMTHWYSTERSREETEQKLREVRAKTEEVENLEAKREEIAAEKAEAEELKAEAESRQADVEELVTHLEAKADAYSDAMAAAADGDLTVRLDPESESEAMTQIGTSFNEMLDETASAMREIQSFAETVKAASEEADAGTAEARTASEEVGRSIQEISDGTADQRERLEQVSGEMTELSATVEEVAASAETVAQRSRETTEIAEDGEQTATDAIDDARDVQAAIDATVDNVETLDEQMAEIGEIIELISDIAEQTNMLALNANIEAARAGDGGGGDGFAVVANEVKQLAEETQDSATEIEQLIEQTQAQTTATVERAREADRDMAESVEAVEEVVGAFELVAENADETDGGIQEIRDTTEEQAASTEEAASMVEEVTDSSRSTATEAETASAAAEEQAASMSQVSANVESLSEQADRLRSLLATFEVGTGSQARSTGGDRATALEDGGKPE
ncbi:methyl-accepting chemotaxis protein [Haloarcula amylovorans]|uniref:methyl-accepting chemotaxis protein n=1 Tax=Haloarcula amylovorans TaxID=2562280 RepID=UPI0010765211|nr:methyl-accepting chemotaxis protein [Halomicroarcula amylolytica]